MKRYTKALIAVVGAIGTWGTTAVIDNAVDPNEWFGLVTALATALGVYYFPNVSPNPVGDPGISETDGEPAL